MWGSMCWGCLGLIDRGWWADSVRVVRSVVGWVGVVDDTGR